MEHFQDRANDGFDEEAPLAGNYEFATNGGADAPVPVVDMGVDDVPADAPEVVVSMVWKGQVLGFAFLAEAVLRFGEVSDTAPEYRMLQACKYTLKPDVIVCPSSSEQGWLHALGLSSLVVPGIALAADEEELQGAAIGEGGSSGSAGGPHVVRMKNRDFHADACAKRLSLLRALSELPKGTSEREVQMYLEHVCPREHEQARRAICRLEQARRTIAAFSLLIAHTRFIAGQLEEDREPKRAEKGKGRRRRASRHLRRAPRRDHLLAEGRERQWSMVNHFPRKPNEGGFIPGHAQVPEGMQGAQDARLGLHLRPYVEKLVLHRQRGGAQHAQAQGLPAG